MITAHIDKKKERFSMKNIAIINVVQGRSTGKIATNLLNEFNKKGLNAWFFYGRGPKSKEERKIRFEYPVEVMFHAFFARLLGLQGFFSYIATKRLVRKLRSLNIDTVILINPHAYYLNERVLYSFLDKQNLRFINIIPDEYAYLGNCAVSPVCQRYLTGNGKCPNIHDYPNSWFFDSCSIIMHNKECNYKKLKRAVFVGPGFVIDNLKKSYLGKYMPCAVLDEAINLDLYRPLNSDDLRSKLGIEDRKIVILCIAPPYKGLEYFKEVASHFRDDERYVFVHVGKENENVDCINYINIEYVESNSDLVYFYSMADLFLFPSLADTMSNACLESLACGTPLLVFDISGMPYLLDESVGTLVAPRDVNALIEVVSKTKKKTVETIQQCRIYAEKRYDIRKYADKVIEIAKHLS